MLNLWCVIEEGTGYAYVLLGRAYAMTGTDAEKLGKLRQLAPTNYLMTERLRVPENFQVVFTNGKKMKGYAEPAYIRENIGLFYEEVFKRIEEQMPPIFNFTEGKLI